MQLVPNLRGRPFAQGGPEEWCVGCAQTICGRQIYGEDSKKCHIVRKLHGIGYGG